MQKSSKTNKLINFGEKNFQGKSVDKIHYRKKSVLNNGKNLNMLKKIFSRIFFNREEMQKWLSFGLLNFFFKEFYFSSQKMSFD